MRRHALPVYRTITDLPSELLHMILSPISKHAWTMRSCSLTCHRLREVAVEYFFRRGTLKITNIISFDHLLRFLRKHRRVANRIAELSLQGAGHNVVEDGVVRGYEAVPVIDELVVASLLELLPALHTLAIDYVRYALPAGDGKPISGHSPRPFALKQLRLRAKSTPRSSLSGVFRVLSMFSVQTLLLSIDHAKGEEEQVDQLHLRFLHRPISANVVNIERLSELEGTPHTLLTFKALAACLDGTSLRDLTVCLDSPQEVEALSRLLLRAGSNTKALRIRLDGRRLVASVESHFWESLNIQSCTTLEEIHIPIYMGSLHSGPAAQKALSKAAVNILRQAPNTLLEVFISVFGFTKPTNLSNRSILRLHDLDKVLVASQFPALRKVEVYIEHDTSRKIYQPRRIYVAGAAAVCRVLPGLHGRGVLNVTWSEHMCEG